MKRIAIVVPRCHESLTGGAEAHAWQYATLLAGDYAVDVLTTTASDYVSWANDLREGVERRDGVAIRRFRVARERGLYFHDLHRRLLAHVEANGGRVDWPEALQEEFVRAQGPVCPGLIEHLDRHGDDYAAVIFLTYLYPTTYDGTRALRHRRWGLVPTLHDEPPAYFGVYAQMARRVPRILWNTAAERRLGRRLWGIDAGNLVAMTVATDAVAPARESTPYLLYCGRIDTHKGCAMLIEAFENYQRAQPSNLRLLLTGADKLGVRESEHVRYLGFVSEERKLALMAGALVFVHPSPYESLSIVALEAMAQGTPIVVNGECEILADHVAASGSGFVFRGEAELHAAIDAVRALDTAAREDQARAARAYVTGNYSREQVRARLIAEIEALAAN
ncbi:glycosyltransferase family 4 protein [Dokdonella sp.]|uniref:glycosyltransferase family 4 protein n=1 Tax=Dokdonella sp. TaxID=2291710 RepID=UPI001B2A416A|nr:glycosyltransferase family 4 protein [Dokdonella sp.]MBO9661403.1 glycosyltransferase family 4 protein [Dokdonella sp.]